jgi:hypothetical protein
MRRRSALSSWGPERSLPDDVDELGHEQIPCVEVNHDAEMGLFLDVHNHLFRLLSFH